MFMRRTFGTHKDNPDRPLWSAGLEEEHRRSRGPTPGHHSNNNSNKQSQSQFDRRRRVRREQESLGAVDDDTACGIEALTQEQMGVLLGKRDAGVLGSLVGSREDQADEIMQLFRGLRTDDPFGYTAPRSVPTEPARVVNCPDILSVLEPKEPREDEQGAEEDIAAPLDAGTREPRSDDDGDDSCADPGPDPDPAQACTADGNTDGSATLPTPLWRHASELLAPEAVELYLMSLSRPMVCSFCGAGVGTDQEGMAFPGHVPLRTVCVKDDCLKAHLAAAMQGMAQRPLNDTHGDPSAIVGAEKSPTQLEPTQWCSCEAYQHSASCRHVVPKPTDVPPSCIGTPCNQHGYWQGSVYPARILRLQPHMRWVDIDLRTVRTTLSSGMEVEQGPTLNDAAAAGLWPLRVSILNDNHELRHSLQHLSINLSSSKIALFIPVSDLEDLRVGRFSGGSSLRGLLEARAKESRLNGMRTCKNLSHDTRGHVLEALLSYGCGKMHFEVMLGSGDTQMRAHCPACAVYKIEKDGETVLMGGAAATCMDGSSCVEMRVAPRAPTSKRDFQRAMGLVHHPDLHSILIPPPRVHDLLQKHDDLANKRPPGDGAAVATEGTDVPPATDSGHCDDVKFNCRQEEVGKVSDEWSPGKDTAGLFYCMCEHGVMCLDGALAMTSHETFGHARAAQGEAMQHRTFGPRRFRAPSYPKKDKYGRPIKNPTYRVMYDLACSYRKKYVNYMTNKYGTSFGAGQYNIPAEDHILALGMFHAQGGHTAKCALVHGQYYVDGTALVQGDAPEPLNKSFRKHYLNMSGCSAANHYVSLALIIWESVRVAQDNIVDCLKRKLRTALTDLDEQRDKRQQLKDTHNLTEPHLRQHVSDFAGDIELAYSEGHLQVVTDEEGYPDRWYTLCWKELAVWAIDQFVNGSDQVRHQLPLLKCAPIPLLRLPLPTRNTAAAPPPPPLIRTS